MDTEFLTTKEVAELLRLKERKVYDLSSDGSIPCTRATGKLLFSRAAIDRWLQQHSSGVAMRSPATLICGSHDPLLEWAVRESQCGIATLFDGSVDGSDRIASGEATVAALHIYEASSRRWNVDYVRRRHDDCGCVLVSWIKRRRGIVYREGDCKEISSLLRLSIADRQPGAGSQIVLESLLLEAGLNTTVLNVAITARSESDAVIAVVDGSADCTLGLEALALQHQLKFLPLIEESFDLLVDRRFWFEPAMQQFIAFCQSSVFKKKLESMHGYKITDLFSVVRNL